MSQHCRLCSFCGRGDLPDESIVYLGITACAYCLETEATKDFRELLELQKEDYDRRFERKQDKCSTITAAR